MYDKEMSSALCCHSRLVCSFAAFFFKVYWIVFFEKTT